MSEEEKEIEKKIIVDEDWKSRVETEKEEVRKQEESKSKEKEAEGEEKKGEEKKEPAEAASAGPAQPLPPPSFSFLCGSIYLQALIALGIVQNPLSEKAEVNLDQAKHSIDLLAMLQEKTEGNRTREETDELERMMHELRMGFVAVQQQEAGKTE